MFLVLFVLFALAVIAICTAKSCDYEILLYIGAIIIVLELIGAICYALAYYPAEYTCEKKAKMLGIEYKYDLIGGCFIRDEKGWFEYNQQRVVR